LGRQPGGPTSPERDCAGPSLQLGLVVVPTARPRHLSCGGLTVVRTLTPARPHGVRVGTVQLTRHLWPIRPFCAFDGAVRTTIRWRRLQTRRRRKLRRPWRVWIGSFVVQGALSRHLRNALPTLEAGDATTPGTVPGVVLTSRIPPKEEETLHISRLRDRNLRASSAITESADFLR
jgi:hypothetical protein